MCVMAGWIPFALAHFSSGYPTGFAAGVAGGFYLAFTYANWRTESLRAALGMTIASHALGNFACVVAMIILS